MRPGEKIDFRLVRFLRNRGAVHKPVEQLRHGLGRVAAKDEDSAGIFIKMEESGFLDVGEEPQFFASAGGQKPVNPVLERHQPLRAGLKVHMVRSRGPAYRAVVESEIFIMLPDEIKKILIAMPDGLPRVLEAGDHEVRREDRVRIQCDTVFPSLAALELDVGLLRRAVLRTEEAGPLAEGLRVKRRFGRNLAARVVLYSHVKPAYVQAFHLRFLEIAVILGGQRPDRKLVIYEFVNLIIHQSNANKVSLIDLNSCSKFGVNSPRPRFDSISDIRQ